MVYPGLVVRAIVNVHFNQPGTVHNCSTVAVSATCACYLIASQISIVAGVYIVAEYRQVHILVDPVAVGVVNVLAFVVEIVYESLK